jgi:hypothetical protein
MGGAQWLLEIVLVLLLAATLFHAVRLERALGVLKRDRSVLEELVEGFNESTRQAESGIDRLRIAADGAGRQMARQIEQSQRLRDDLTFLAERGERLAERLESAVRAARMAGDQHEGPLLQAISVPAPAPAKLAVPGQPHFAAAVLTPSRESMSGFDQGTDASEGNPRLRSQAERDLLRALRTGR